MAIGTSGPLPASDPRAAIRDAHLTDETALVRRLADDIGLDDAARAAIVRDAADWVRAVRGDDSPGVMQAFLIEYGLSSREGVALMCLAEALLRVPDAETIDALIADKIAPADWGRHLGHSSSSLVNASTWALMLTGRVVAPEPGDSLAHSLHGLIRRLGEPVVRAAVGAAMRELGEQFVLGADIRTAIDRGAEWQARGFTYSFDMLGEAARTETDARRYQDAYAGAIGALAGRDAADLRDRPGISIKLSALHPRYEAAQADMVTAEMAARLLPLAQQARVGGVALCVDAEEAERLDLSLDVIEAVLADPSLDGWDGFGLAVQAYDRRAVPVLDWVYDLAGRLGRRIAVRLVKGAYWDSQIKRSQVMGFDSYPVFTRKSGTDVSYLACARRLLARTDRLFPQFATHNAHTMRAVLHMAGDETGFEFQRLHGMGEALHDTVHAAHGTRHRIYAPVGAHEDLLAYLVRRLLENGANSSFVHRIVDSEVPPEAVAADPLAAIEAADGSLANPSIPAPADIYGPERRAARGWDLGDPATLTALAAAREPFRRTGWQAAPVLADTMGETAVPQDARSPVNGDDIVGQVATATAEHIEAAFRGAAAAFPAWSARPVSERAACLDRLADLYEESAPELMALMAREAGKILLDGVAEIREAVDFCRYYAAEARRAGDGEGRGIIVCISPWNFPLAIFTGQIAAALVTGNAVIAKPAEQTPLTAARAVDLMQVAGIPRGVIQMLPGDGPAVGAPLVADPRVAGVCFTGSVQTARAINRTLAERGDPRVPLIAETGGINAMVVDSTALPEQAVRDILASAFQSAGQRCSALRMLYVQADAASRLLDMLAGAMETLCIGDPWDAATDIGPLIDGAAQADVGGYGEAMVTAGHQIAALDLPAETGAGHFVAPRLLRIGGIEDVAREVFGPILHVATYEVHHLDDVVDAINARGFGLTFGMHSRVDDRVQQMVARIHAGNIYVNRNQIGAVVGVQPFGGEGLSGTGPKAGGPHYLRRFRRPADLDRPRPGRAAAAGRPIGGESLEREWAALSDGGWAARADRLDALDGARRSLSSQEALLVRDALAAARAALHEPAELPGPTGESNRLTLHPRGPAVCLGDLSGDDGSAAMIADTVFALAAGNPVLVVGAGAAALARALAAAGAPVCGLDGDADPADVAALAGLGAVGARGTADSLRPLRRALAARAGLIVPLVVADDPVAWTIERVVSVDTTAAGGNAALLAAAGD